MSVDVEVQTPPLPPGAATQASQAPHLRNLHMLFEEIEREFEALHQVNCNLREQLQARESTASGKSVKERVNEWQSETHHAAADFSSIVKASTSYQQSQRNTTVDIEKPSVRSPISSPTATQSPVERSRAWSLRLASATTNKRENQVLQRTSSISSIREGALVAALDSLPSNAEAHRGTRVAGPGRPTSSRPGSVPVSTSRVHKQRMRDKIRQRGQRLVSNAVERVRHSSVAVTRVLRTQAGNVEWSLHKQFSGHSDGVWHIAVCPWVNESSETIIASASADRTARIWSAESGREIASLVGHRGSVNSVCFHPSQRLLCSASGDKTCCVWRVPSDDDRDWDASVFGPEGTTSTTASVCNAVSTSFPSVQMPGRMPRRKTVRPVLGIVGHSNVVSAAAWMGSRGLIATSSWDRTAQVFDVASGTSKPLRTLGGHDGPLTWIAATSGSSVVMSASKDCTARLWDARAKMPLLHVFQGHSNTVCVRERERESARARARETQGLRVGF
jgi:WD40 repeat protein